MEKYEECHMPNCTRPATKMWQGTPVCSDCYDKNREAYNRILQGIEDIS